MTKPSAHDIPCYAVYHDDFHYSREWGKRMVDLWIATKKAQAQEKLTTEAFRRRLQEGIFNAIYLRADFEQACKDVGIRPTDKLFAQYREINLPAAFDLLPSGLHAEFCWVPEWDGANLDDLIETHGLRSDRWKSSYIEDIQPCNGLAVFLRLVNQSSAELLLAAAAMDTDGRRFVEKCQKAGFVVEKDPNRPSILTGEEVIATIENAYTNAVPAFHCEVNVRALFEHDPTTPMRMTARDGKVHVGFHEFINGAGYLDCYPGEVVIPPGATGFAGENRWPYGIDKVYGIVKSAFYTVPR